MSREANVLHADLDAFFASVEQRDDPKLRGKPVIVGPGVVMAASYEARAFGIRSAMNGRRARELCPQAIVVSPRFDAYVEAGEAVAGLFQDAVPVVERLSIDEAFLDARGLEHIKGTPTQIAQQLRRDVRERIGLPITVGVARTKFLAKVASGQAKPDGLLVVPPDKELDFLHPLDAQALWGVGPATAEKLHAVGLRSVGEVAKLPESRLVELVGQAAGRKLHALAHNRDPRPVKRTPRRRSVGSQCALGIKRFSPETLDATVLALVDRVTRRMRAKGRAGRTVVLRMRFGDFGRATRSHTLPSPTSATSAVLAEMRALLAAERELIDERGLTMVGVTVANLEAGSRQLQLPIDERHGDVLDHVLDEVRDRFGATAVTRASLLHRAPRLATWLFPAEDD